MQVQLVIEEIVKKLSKINGITAIVLGGSRAKGTSTPKSDIDIGIYYKSELKFDIPKLQETATEIDDTQRNNLITQIGEWGPWINGGGWLTVHGYKVDFLFRDFHKVETVMEQCRTGDVTIDYYPGHPHGFINAIYLSEVAHCKILWDPSDSLSTLKKQTIPYPEKLKRSLIDKFFWEASFSLVFAKKGIDRLDVSHVSGSCFRSISCLNQVIFAINECYWMNETGSIDIANSLAITPKNYKSKVNETFGLLLPDSEKMEKAINIMEDLISEVEGLVMLHS
ncbi:nucleotidyltransferase domain-containing protein [Lederbergia citri]|uniref:Nucleotidyltransferase domain-containing protein n=1 Tax=Lederbergia citri TaxID=2833580 RepID=A0A942TGH1_9BACI|nr:nucleotidyltransferase domain-containing protein [Lederbergia citri]MBS4197606.1 nucleotidyltransferase domain-containing protein [Lederbergia citri]